MFDQAAEFLSQFKSKKIPYLQPTESDKSRIRNLLFLIKEYDEHGLTTSDKVNLLGNSQTPAAQNADIVKKINAELDALNMKATLFTQLEYQNVICFHPNTPDVGQIGFFWRFGKVGVKQDIESTHLPVGPFVISDLHRGIDGASGIALREFNALHAKVYLFNTMHPKSSDLPAPFQPHRNISDGAHSRETLANPFLRTLLIELYPDFALNVAHGMAAVDRKTGKMRFMEMWVINGVRKPFDLTKKSWGALITIALAQKDFEFGRISVSGYFPKHFIIDNKGIKRKLVSEMPYDGKAVFCNIKGPNTDEQIHVVNVSEEKKFQRSGRAVHIEHGVPYRDSLLENEVYLEKQEHILNAFRLAGSWFQHWNDMVHSFITMPGNVREFPQWFNSQLNKLTDNPYLISESKPTMLFAKSYPSTASEDDIGSSDNESILEDDATYEQISRGNKKIKYVHS